MRVRTLASILIIAACVLGVTSSLKAATQVYVPHNHPFPIATVPLNNEYSPVIAYDPVNQQYLVVYANEVGVNSAINAVCLDKAGNAFQTYVLGNGAYPDAVYNPSNNTYIVVWEDSDAGNIGGARVSGSCCPQVGCASAPWNVTYDRPGVEAWPAIAYNEHANHQDMLIVWGEDENQSSHWAIWGRRLSGTTFIGPSFAITSTTTAHNFHPDVAYNLNMNEFIVVYTTDSSKGMDQDALDINARRLYNDPGSTGGLLAETTVDATSRSQDSPQVAAYRLNHQTPYVVVYRDHFSDAAGDIRAAFLQKDGTAQSVINIAIKYNIPEDTPRISSYEPRGGYVVTWVESMSGLHSNVLWRKISPEGWLGNTMEVMVLPVTNWFPDIVNSYPFPFAVWVLNDGTGNDVYGRFLYEKTFLPATLRHP